MKGYFMAKNSFVVELTFNEISQESEMIVMVQYWDEEEN